MPIKHLWRGEKVPVVTVPVPIATSYFQYDQQGVVFNMWYFGWFDDAMTQFLSEVGYSYTALNADGLDVQLVHTEADWRDAVRYGEQVVIDVATERIAHHVGKFEAGLIHGLLHALGQRVVAQLARQRRSAGVSGERDGEHVVAGLQGGEHELPGPPGVGEAVH